MKVVAYDPFLSAERAVELGIEKADLDTLLAKADFITLHTPLTEQTRNILSRDNIAKAKKGVRIINCARGGLIDEQRSKTHWIAARSAARRSMCLSKNRQRLPLCLARPTSSARRTWAHRTDEAQVNVAIQVAEQLSDYLIGGGITNALNVPSLSAEEAPKLKPYMALAEKLGRMVGQLEGDAITAVAIETEGAAAQLNQKPIVFGCAGRADGCVFRYGQHGQRAIFGEGARHRCARSPPRPRWRL